MFSSISSCTPNVQVSTGFKSTKDQVLNISTDVEIYVNDILVEYRPIKIYTEDDVVARVISPTGFLTHQFYEYYIDGEISTFAVVTKNSYTPIVKTTEQEKKWFNYNSTNILVSFYDSYDQTQRPLGNGKSLVDIADTHIVLDHINFAVCFYSLSQELITRVPLAAGPIEYRKLEVFDNETNTVKTEAVVLCGDRKLYRIRFDNQYYGSDAYNPTVIPVNFYDNLWFEADLPNGASLLDLRRKNLQAKLNPLVTAFDISPNYIWIGGYDTIWILQKNFQYVKTISIPNETIICLACIDNDAIVTTRKGKVFYVEFGGSYANIYNQDALGSPASFKHFGVTYVAIPDPNNQQLLVFFGNTENPMKIETPDIAPAYAREFENSLWITGHDNNTVVKVNPDSFAQKVFSFKHKVTLVSVVQNRIMAVQYHQDRVILDLTGIQKVIPFEVPPRQGPKTHIGTEPAEIKMLGEESIIPIAGPGLTCWINGSTNVPLNTGDYLGVSFKGTTVGNFRRNFVVGENAFDYDVEVKIQRSSLDYYVPNLVTVNSIDLSLPHQYNLTPDVGDNRIGVTSSIDPGFTINVFGNVYSTINVGTNGYITFGDNVPLVDNVAFGDLNSDAIHIETRKLYQGKPFNNINPLNVTLKSLTDGSTPGVYYNTGSVNGIKFLKLKWIGIEADRIETYQSVNTSVESSLTIPVSDIGNIYVDDYVSGDGITQSTKVFNTFTMPIRYANVRSISSYVSANGTNLVRLNLSIPSYPVTDLRKYATVTSETSGNVAYAESFVNYKYGGSSWSAWYYGYNDGELVEVSGNTVVVSGYASQMVNEDYTVSLPVIGWTNSYYMLENNLVSVNRTTRPITVIRAFSSNSIVVDYNLWQILRANDIIFGSGIQSTTKIRSKFAFNGEYWIILDKSFNSSIVQTGAIVYTPVTIFTFTEDILPFNINPVSGGTPNLNIGEYVLYNLFSIDVKDVDTFDLGPINITGNFVTLSRPVTLTSGTELMFNPVIDTTPLTYEVGFYTTNDYQFIEIYYPNNKHLLTTNVGVTSANSSIQSTSVNIGSGRSGVFYSRTEIGDWKFFGDGYLNTDVSFLSVVRSFIPLKSIPEFPATQARVEFTIDQDIDLSGNVKIASSYGTLYVNNGLYNGSTNIKAHDTVSLVAPVNNSLRVIAPIVSIGETQFTVPMLTSAVESPINEIAYLNQNQIQGDTVSTTIIVPITDTYYIPEYYKVTNQVSDLATFKITREEVTTDLVPGNYYDLNAGDILTIENFTISSALYDSRNLDILGSFVLRFIWQTDPGPIFDYLTFDTLVDPYIHNDVYIIEDGEVYVEKEKYITSNLELTSSAPIDGSIYVNDLSANLIINGSIQSDYVTSVATGANVAITRRLFNYFQTGANLYQVKFDTVSNSNVYIQIGEWNVSNRIINGSMLLSTQSQLSKNLTQVFSASSGDLADLNLQSIFERSPTTYTGKLSHINNAVNRGSDVMGRGLKSKLLNRTQEFNSIISALLHTEHIPISKTITSSKLEDPYSIYKTKKVVKSFQGSYTQLTKQITSVFANRGSYISSDTIDPFYSQWNSIIGKKVTLEYVTSTVMLGSVKTPEYVKWSLVIGNKIASKFVASDVIYTGKVSSKFISAATIISGLVSEFYANTQQLSIGGVSSDYISYNYVIGGMVSVSESVTPVTILETDRVVSSVLDSTSTFIDTNKVSSKKLQLTSYLPSKVNSDYMNSGFLIKAKTNSLKDKKVSYLFGSTTNKTSNPETNLGVSNPAEKIKRPSQMFDSISSRYQTRGQEIQYSITEKLLSKYSDLVSSNTPIKTIAETLELLKTDAEVIKKFTILFNKTKGIIPAATSNISDKYDLTIPSSYTISKGKTESDIVKRTTSTTNKQGLTLDTVQTSTLSRNSVTTEKTASLTPNSFEPSIGNPVSNLPIKQDGFLQPTSKAYIAHKFAEQISALSSQIGFVMSQLLETVNTESKGSQSFTTSYPFTEFLFSMDQITNLIRTEMPTRLHETVGTALSELKTSMSQLAEVSSSNLKAKLKEISPTQLTELVNIMKKAVDSVRTELWDSVAAAVSVAFSELEKSPVYDTLTTSTEASVARVFETPTNETEIESKNNGQLEIYSIDVGHEPPWVLLQQAIELMHKNKSTLDRLSDTLLTDLTNILEGMVKEVFWENIVELEGTPELNLWYNDASIDDAASGVRWINYEELAGIPGEVNWYNDHLKDSTISAFPSLAPEVVFEKPITEFLITGSGAQLISQSEMLKYPGGKALLFHTTETIGFSRKPTLFVTTESVGTKREPTLFIPTEAMGFRRNPTLVKEQSYYWPYKHRLLTQTEAVSPTYMPLLFVPFEAVSIEYKPELWRDLPLLKTLKHMFDVPLDVSINLPGELDIIPERPRKLTLSFDQLPERIKTNEMVLEQDVIWTMEVLPDVGAYQTFINIWADNGRGGDLFSNNSDPTNIGPMVLYSKEYKYAPGGYKLSDYAEDQSVKYYSAGIMQIPMTDYWNYRIYFNTRHYCVPKKGMLFPVGWYVRGG